MIRGQGFLAEKNGWDAQQHHHSKAAPQELSPISFPKARNIQAAAQAVHAVVLQNQIQNRKDGQGVGNESSTLRQMCESVVLNVQVIGDVTTTFHIFTGTRLSVAIAKDLPSNPVVDLGTKNEINDQNCCSDDEVTALVGKHLKAQGQSRFQDLGEEDSSYQEGRHEDDAQQDPWPGIFRCREKDVDDVTDAPDAARSLGICGGVLSPRHDE